MYIMFVCGVTYMESVLAESKLCSTWSIIVKLTGTTTTGTINVFDY